MNGLKIQWGKQPYVNATVNLPLNYASGSSYIAIGIVHIGTTADGENTVIYRQQAESFDYRMQQCRPMNWLTIGY